MEGVPRIPMLSFPIRKSADTPAFKGKLQKFIAVQYGERPDSYSKEIHELESLRAGAVHASHDYSGCAILKKYYCQLHFLKSRFPLNEGSPVSIIFSWYDVFSDPIHSWSDIDFEISSVLFNIGALHSKVAGADSRTTVDDMKNCVTHYQCAAWAFEHLRSNFAKFFTPDMSSELLSLMSNICLAQAQECVVEKSLVDNRRSVITAKLLLQIVDYYQVSLKTVELILKDVFHHSVRKVRSVKKWKQMIELKIAYYSSLTFLYRGQQAEDQKQYGERVSFYKAAQDKIEISLKLSKDFEKADNVHETLNFVHDVVVGKATSAQKDNEFIYHEKVPAIEAIAETIKGVAIVKPIPLKIDDLGADIFARLVPMQAHEASSLYSEEKAKLLRSYAQKIEDKNASLQKFIIAIQLENLDLDEFKGKVPQELVDCCASMNGQPDAVKKLVELMGTLSGMFVDVDEKLAETKKIFETQHSNEAELGRILGKMPQPSNVFVEIRHEFEKLDKAHTLAKSSNDTLREAADVHLPNLKLLMKPLPELIKTIPSPGPIAGKELEAVDEMKRLASKVEEMRKQRIHLEQELRDAVQQDDITQRLVVTEEDQVDELFQKELVKHNKITQLIDQNLLAQENIMRALTETNARYAGTREGTQKVMAERNVFVQGLLTSFQAYDELVQKCQGGIDFYRKLEETVGKLYARAKSIAKVQDEEREAKMNAIRPPVFPQIPVGPPCVPDQVGVGGGPGHPKLKDYLANRKKGQQALPTNYAPSAPIHHQYPPSVPPTSSAYYRPIETVPQQPIQSFQQQPSQSVQQPPIHSFQQQPNQPVQQPPLQSFQQPPNQSVQQQANQSVQRPPIHSFQQQPSQSVQQPPIQTFQHQLNQSVQQPPIQSFQQPPNQSVQQPPIQSFRPQPSQPVQQPPIQSFQQQPSQSVQQPPNQSFQHQFIQQPPIQSFQQQPSQSVQQLPSQSFQHQHQPSQFVQQPPIQSFQHQPRQSVQQPPIQSAQQPPIQSAQQPPIQSFQQHPNQSVQPPPIQSAQQPPIQPFQQHQNQSVQPPPIQSAQQPPIQSFQQHPNQSVQQPPIQSSQQPPIQSFQQHPNQSVQQPPIPSAQQPPIQSDQHQPYTSQPIQFIQSPFTSSPHRLNYPEVISQANYTPSSYDQPIQSLFSTSQNINYPEVISKGNYAPKEQNYGGAYAPFTSQYDSYYGYNNSVPSQTHVNIGSTNQVPHSGVASNQNTSSSITPLPVQHGVPKNLDLLTGIDIGPTPLTPILPPTH